MNRSTLIAAVSAVVLGMTSYNVLSPEAKWDAKEASAAEATPGPIAIMDTHDLMKYLLDPTFEELKEAIEVAPEKRSEWRAVSSAAASLAEFNNLLYIRTDEDFVTHDQWTESVADSQKASLDLARSVKDQAEFAVLKEKFLGVMQSCNDCHTNVAPDEELDEIEGPASW